VYSKIGMTCSLYLFRAPFTSCQTPGGNAECLRQSLSTITKHPAARIACFALLFRIVSAVLAFYADVVFPLFQREQFTMFGRTSPFWDPFTRYDSGWYYGIARTGYDASTAVAGGRSNIAFFPCIRC